MQIDGIEIKLTELDYVKEILSVIVAFIEDNKISCPEATCDDSVYENAPEFVYKLCNLVGYYEYEEDE